MTCKHFNQIAAHDPAIQSIIQDGSEPSVRVVTVNQGSMVVSYNIIRDENGDYYADVSVNGFIPGCPSNGTIFEGRLFIDDIDSFTEQVCSI